MDTILRFLSKPWFYLAVVILGTGLKFYQLDHKLFWQDEISTVLYTSGAKSEVIKATVPINEIKNVSYLDSLFHQKSSSRTIEDEVEGILSDTHLTPAHYVFLTVWHRLVGNEDQDYRLFSVFIFILTLPFVFLLAKTLFKSSLAGWIALSLFAVSPFIHFEAQEARYYILWVFFFVLSNFFFLEALKRQSVIWWVAYSFVCILGFYTSLLFATLIIGHFIFILMTNKDRLIPFFISAFFIFLSYLPWMYFLFTVRETIKGGLAWHTMFHTNYFSLDLLFFQLLGFVKSFSFQFDNSLYLDWFMGNTRGDIYIALLIDLIVLSFILYSLFYLFRQDNKELKWFMASTILPLFLLLYCSDLLRSGFTSFLWRYQVVNMVVIILLVTHLVTDKIGRGNLLYIGFYAGLIILGISSMLTISSNRCWMGRPDCSSNIETAHFISEGSNPLLLTDFGNWGFENLLAIVNESKSKNADIMVCKGKVPEFPAMLTGKDYTDIYLIEASDSLARQVELQFGNKMIPFRKAPHMFAPQVWHIKLR